MFDRQQAFTRAVTHLLQQGEPAVAPDDPETCMYRTSNGLKCGIGCLIPDDRYNPNMENKNAGTVEVTNGLDPELGDPRDHLVFLRDMQRRLHDNWISDFTEEGPPTPFPDYVRKQAKTMATLYDFPVSAHQAEAWGLDQ